jgi:hypothetical protein
MSERDGNGDYEVGYGKPPKHSRFLPGQSGNPRGKQKGKKGLKSDLAVELDAKDSIKIQGIRFEGRRQKLMIMTLAARAARGDTKAAQLLIPLIVQAFGFEDRGIGPRTLSVQDQAILDDLLRDTVGEASPEPQAGSGGSGDRPPVGTVEDAPDNDGKEGEGDDVAAQ